MVEKHEPPKHEPPPPPPPHPAAGKPPDLRTEQERGAKDPVDKPVFPSPIPESIEDLGIGPRDPYPDGSPPKQVAGQPMNARQDPAPGPNSPYTGPPVTHTTHTAHAKEK